MSSRLKLAGICFAAAFVLAACGGGGSPLDTARAERDRLAALLAQVTAARDAALNQVATLTADLNTANQNLMDRQAELDAANQNLMDRQAELDAANADLTSTQADLDTANANLMTAQSALDTANANLMTAQSALDTANADLMAKQTALDDAQAEVDRLVASGTATQEQLDAANANLMTAQSDLTTAQGDVTRLTDELATANADVTRLTDELATANADVTRLTDELATANADVTRLTDELATAQADVTRLTDELATAQADVTRLQGELDDANAVNGLFAAAQTSRAAADAAVMAAKDAVDDAVANAGNLDVASVKGNSAMAAANAQAVRTAEAAANQAVMDAEAAQMAAESALADAMALDDSATKIGLVASLEAAVEHAKAQVTAAKAARDINPMTDDTPPVVTPAVDSLAEAVAAVTGGENADPQGTPKSIGDGVAMQVAMALLPMEDDPTATLDGTPERVTHYANQGALDGATPPAVADRTFHMNDSEGMTWEMIVGAAVATKTISAGTGISVLTAVKATPISSTVSFATDPTNVPAAGTNAALGLELDQGATHMGIPGFVFCGGADCSQNAAGDLTGSWYFRPTSTTAVYVMNADGTAYMEDTMFSQWGHWLTVSGADVTIHTYATTGANTANLNVGVATGCDPECSASYSGSAAGMSVHKTYDGDGNQLTIDSGAFTARVSLTARFGTVPMLGGTVDQFRGGPQVDSAWSVTLQDTAIDTTSAAVTGGVAKGSGQAGDWAAQGYGPAQTPAEGANPAVNHRPDGFIGNFNAHFSDGHAAGAFVTD